MSKKSLVHQCKPLLKMVVSSVQQGTMKHNVSLTFYQDELFFRYINLVLILHRITLDSTICHGLNVYPLCTIPWIFSINNKLVIISWSMWEQDKFIIRQIKYALLFTISSYNASMCRTDRLDINIKLRLCFVCYIAWNAWRQLTLCSKARELLINPCMGTYYSTQPQLAVHWNWQVLLIYLLLSCSFSPGFAGRKDAKAFHPPFVACSPGSLYQVLG